ncbi:hypothetical protein C7M84_007511 [Penaeus vannamei]|uniref:Uncharacterized protein n=1 Tax=Penaeus vannamei TaxID=6689 RepID=A0A3R7M795_PENVA|nr:hypothetical protein C7M84_007511 [Penaeus vannamei]
MDTQKYVNEPICPLYIKPVWEEAVVSVLRFWVRCQARSVINRSTVTIPAPPIYKTETIIVPEEKTVMSARIDTVAYTITQTNLEVITYTLTNTITTTTFEAEWITLTEYETSWETVNVPVTSITTIWTQEVEVVTQPVYVTTNLWVEAPQLSLITSTHYVPHYHTQTTTVTNKVYETICTKPGYY